jgi:hypothetical protein
MQMEEISEAEDVNDDEQPGDGGDGEGSSTPRDVGNVVSNDVEGRTDAANDEKNHEV